MAYFDKISIDGTSYDVRDSDTRSALTALDDELNLLQTDFSQLQDDVEDLSNKLQPWISPDDYGAVGNGITDDSAAFSKAFAVSGNLVLTKGKTYYIETPLTVTTNVHIIGSGATISAGSALIQSDDVQRLIFNNQKTVIEGVNFTSNASTNQWSTGVASMVACYCLNISSPTIRISGCNFANIWGYGIRILNATNVTIDGCSFTGVGGHYMENNDYDMFGDSIWLGNTNANQYASITNCRLVGLSSGSTLSRCGITLEYSTSNDRYLTVSSCYIADYDRTIHAENIGNCYITVNSSQIVNTNVYAFAYSIQNLSRITFNDCSIQTTGNDYNGTRGARNFGSMVFNSCTINYAGPFIWSMAANQLPSVKFNNCYILAYLRGTAATSPLIDNGEAYVMFESTWYEAITNQLGNFFSSGTQKTVVINSVIAAGAAGWSGSAKNTLYSLYSDITGINTYQVVSSTNSVA